MLSPFKPRRKGGLFALFLVCGGLGVGGVRRIQAQVDSPHPVRVQVAKPPRLLAYGREDARIEAEVSCPGQGGRIHAPLNLTLGSGQIAQVYGEPAHPDEEGQEQGRKEQYTPSLILKPVPGGDCSPECRSATG